MSILIWVLIGLISGWLADFITGSGGGIITDLIVGVLGSLVGGAIVIFLQTNKLDFTKAFTDFQVSSVIVSTFGAIVLLVLLRIIRKLF